MANPTVKLVMTVLGVEGRQKDGTIEHGMVVLSHAGTSSEDDFWTAAFRIAPNDPKVTKQFKDGDMWEVTLTQKSKAVTDG